MSLLGKLDQPELHSQYVRVAAVGASCSSSSRCSSQNIQVVAVVAVAASMLGLSLQVCTTHCEGQCYGKDADRVSHLQRCAAQSVVRVVQVSVVTILDTALCGLLKAGSLL